MNKLDAYVFYPIVYLAGRDEIVTGLSETGVRRGRQHDSVVFLLILQAWDLAITNQFVIRTLPTVAQYHSNPHNAMQATRGVSEKETACEVSSKCTTNNLSIDKMSVILKRVSTYSKRQTEQHTVFYQPV